MLFSTVSTPTDYVSHVFSFPMPILEAVRGRGEALFSMESSRGSRPAASERTCLRDLPPRKLSSSAGGVQAVRLVAAIHIVIFHYSDLEIGMTGNSWVPFFFALSGFGVACSRVSSSSSTALREAPCSALLPSPRTLVRRLSSVYPTYLLAFCWSLGMMYLSAPQAMARWYRMWPCGVAELLLLQLYVPGCHYDRLIGQFREVNTPDWFISALALMWLLENGMIHLAARATASTRALVVALLAWLAWAIFYPAANVPLYSGAAAFNFAPLSQRLSDACLVPSASNAAGWLCTWFTPAGTATCYVHIYFAGMLTALVLHDRASAGRPPLRKHAGAVALLLLAAALLLPWRQIFGVAQNDLAMFYGHFYKTVDVLLPLHLLLIAAFFESVEPIAAALNDEKWARATGWAGKLAMPVYLLQWPVTLTYTRIMSITSKPLGIAHFLLVTSVLLLVSFAVHVLLQDPIGRAVNRCVSGKKAAGAPSAPKAIAQADKSPA